MSTEPSDPPFIAGLVVRDDGLAASELAGAGEPPADAPAEQARPTDDVGLVLDGDESAGPALAGASRAGTDERDAPDAGADWAAPQSPTQPGRQRSAFPPLADVLQIGDAGRQAEIVPVHGPLSVGVSDTELDFFTAEPFEIRACSTRGLSHRHAGVPRQDAFCLAVNDGWVALCVADGVSQGKHSQVAAETAARAACKLALDGAEDLPGLDWTALANRVSRRILDEARYRRLVDLSGVDDPAEQVRTVRAAMSTTAVVALVSRAARADGAFDAVVAVLAGDSGAFRLEAGALAVLAGGKSLAGSVTDSSVHPLPGPASPVVLEATLCEGQALLLTSDGIGDPVGDGAGDVGSELARRWAQPPTAAEMFTDVNFLRRSYDDDRTAVGIWVLPTAG